ncbi:Gti1/Pac2 domain-containing protein [Hamiltosporidium magnivora]|uniref:Gti1/Pac2 domain-containing protein n=1 Tax=Hamiltosporidium magnivora TaxID=148818 RepID=A0A4Q9KTD6_9MICR|nr:Gti1/Pac2 domain-containing protein [Hamiltosporidium magnivora]
MKIIRGYITDYEEALLIVHGIRLGLLPITKSRLSISERKEIRSGCIYCFVESKSGIKRWTDGKIWSPSMIVGKFLMYKEVPQHLSKTGLKKYNSSSYNSISDISENENNRDENNRDENEKYENNRDENNRDENEKYENGMDKKYENNKNGMDKNGMTEKYENNKYSKDENKNEDKNENSKYNKDENKNENSKYNKDESKNRGKNEDNKSNTNTNNNNPNTNTDESLAVTLVSLNRSFYKNNDIFTFYKKTISVPFGNEIYHIISYFQPVFAKYSLSKIPFYINLGELINKNNNLLNDSYVCKIREENCNFMEDVYSFGKPTQENTCACLNRKELEKIAVEVLISNFGESEGVSDKKGVSDSRSEGVSDKKGVSDRDIDKFVTNRDLIICIFTDRVLIISGVTNTPLLTLHILTPFIYYS